MRLWALAVAGVMTIGGCVFVIVLRRRWLRQERAAVDRRIKTNTAVTKPEFAIVDDSLRVKTGARRETADRMRARAAHVESGASASQVLRMVAKR